MLALRYAAENPEFRFVTISLRADTHPHPHTSICYNLELTKKGNENDTSLIRCHVFSHSSTVADGNAGRAAAWNPTAIKSG